MFEVKIADQTYALERKADQLFINGSPFQADVQRLDAQHFHILAATQSYRIEVRALNRLEKTAQLLINGKPLSVEIATEMDLLLKKMGIQSQNTQAVSHLKAPMPGLVVDILVKEGDTIEKGEPLLILEAMKMENALKAPIKATIKAIKVEKRQNVEKGAVLIEFEN
ncbi:biotin/lipoyl-containing protein [Hugenholtzia roseola]|uniref:biotin/lipoyl-containing protein n=1 Tax=Hugenholtzia roseola TaxID=1002 RepID=UPI0003FC0C42|nr:acetyl-CoA carboxylase biotin carboxyl carrier protein subunit [Hugenholtzia roseola]